MALKSILNKIINIHLLKQKHFYSKLIKKNDLCFDIGANVGNKSKLFLSLKTKVIAFEPQSKCEEYLKKIKNPNFEYYSFGIGSKNEIKELNLANHIEVATFSDKMIDFYTTENLKWNRIEKVTVKKLDTLIEKFGLPDFCKIDTEGFEFEILSHLTYKIPMIEFEFTEAFILDTLKIIKLLNKENTLYNYNLNEKPKFELSNWITSNEMIQTINELPKKRLHGNIFVKNK